MWGEKWRSQLDHRKEKERCLKDNDDDQRHANLGGCFAVVDSVVQHVEAAKPRVLMMRTHVSLDGRNYDGINFTLIVRSELNKTFDEYMRTVAIDCV